MAKTQGNFLGLDYGTRYIGVAFSAGDLAEPLTTLSPVNQRELLPLILKLISEKQIKIVVIGLPEGRLVKNVQQFTAALKKLASVSVILSDETLSTHEAQQKLYELKIPWVKRKEKEHEIAACLILQDYLDHLKNSC